VVLGLFVWERHTTLKLETGGCVCVFVFVLLGFDVITLLRTFFFLGDWDLFGIMSMLGCFVLERVLFSF